MVFLSLNSNGRCFFGVLPCSLPALHRRILPIAHRSHDRPAPSAGRAGLAHALARDRSAGGPSTRKKASASFDQLTPVLCHPPIVDAVCLLRRGLSLSTTQTLVPNRTFCHLKTSATPAPSPRGPITQGSVAARPEPVCAHRPGRLRALPSVRVVPLLGAALGFVHTLTNRVEALKLNGIRIRCRYRNQIVR